MTTGWPRCSIQVTRRHTSQRVSNFAINNTYITKEKKAHCRERVTKYYHQKPIDVPVLKNKYYIHVHFWNNHHNPSAPVKIKAVNVEGDMLSSDEVIVIGKWERSLGILEFMCVLERRLNCRESFEVSEREGWSDHARDGCYSMDESNTLDFLWA